MRRFKPITIDTTGPSGAGRCPAMPAYDQSAGQWSSAGYTLVETLVAIMLLALALTIVLQQFSSALNAGHTSEDFTRAVWYAREKMEEIQLSPVLAAGTRNGSLNGRYRWQATIERFDAEEEVFDRPVGSSVPIPLQISVRVFWPYGQGSKDITLQTMVLRQANGLMEIDR